MLNKFNTLGVDTEGIIKQPDRPTTRKTRIIAANQHVLRIDRETKEEISKDTLEALIKFIEDTLPDIDVVLISDYGKGLITKTLISRLIGAV